VDKKMKIACRNMTRSLTVLPVFSAALIALGAAGLFASTSALAQSAASAPTAASAAMPKMGAAHHVAPHRSAAAHQDFVTKRLNAMHAELGITEAQSTQWDAFAQTMRDSAANTDAAYKGRADKLATLNADEAMKSYADLAQLHAENTQKLAAAFSTLYASFSDAQKQNADVMFRNQRAQRQAMKRPQKRAPASSAAAASAPAPASH
jgi:phage/plasmid-associated DNA primase